MADQKYSEVVKLLRRAESLLSSNPSPNKQLLRQRDWVQDKREWDLEHRIYKSQFEDRNL